MDNREDTEVVMIDVPESIKSKNLVVKVTSGDNKSLLVYSNAQLVTSVDKEEGLVKVFSSEMKKLSKVYVKVFSRNSGGSIEFFKDGYTDIRGSFLYFDDKNSNYSNFDKFSVFVNHPELGKPLIFS